MTASDVTDCEWFLPKSGMVSRFIDEGRVLISAGFCCCETLVLVNFVWVLDGFSDFWTNQVLWDNGTTAEIYALTRVVVVLRGR